jgi:tRNA-(ms[2]io[6]A)-hydroxylase
MLHLASDTDPSWAERALGGLDELLVDHALCEKKAASTALKLLFDYPDRAALLRPLSELAREELEHFEQVLQQLRERGTAFRRLSPTPYAKGLRQALRAGEPERLLDTLLTCALIEARSCERMQLLAEALPGGGLKDFYSSLLACEARHHRLYTDLAETVASRELVRTRLGELAAHEAAVLAAAPPQPRLHG